MGSDLPLELRLGLRAGSVFYFQSNELNSAEPHFFIVVNRDPLQQKVLLLIVVTSKVERVKFRNRGRPSTYVEIAPTEYGEFKVPSAVDCNQLIEKPLQELADMVERRQVRYHKDVPAMILEKIRTAIHTSPVVETELKALV